MNELSLFSGAGGGLLGTKLLGWRHVGYVEYERYCQQVIAQRIKDGFLDEAPIFGDIDHFIESGASKKYAGFVDVVTAGFPCQPFSVAGKQKGQDDERNKWPQTIQCICDVRPRYALLENVPGLLNSGYFQEILGSLAQAGYDAKWIVFGADDVGAPHRRKRLWILADSKCGRGGVQPRALDREAGTIQAWGEQIQSRSEVRDSSTHVADTPSDRKRGETDTGFPPQSFKGGPRMEKGRDKIMADSDGAKLGRKSDWWSTEPNVGRVVNGVASRVDRLKAIGNGQVPAVAATAWEILA